jgi:hypothetical protein
MVQSCTHSVFIPKTFCLIRQPLLSFAVVTLFGAIIVPGFEYASHGTYPLHRK